MTSIIMNLVIYITSDKNKNSYIIDCGIRNNSSDINKSSN